MSVDPRKSAEEVRNEFSDLLTAAENGRATMRRCGWNCAKPKSRKPRHDDIRVGLFVF